MRVSREGCACLQGKSFHAATRSRHLTDVILITCACFDRELPIKVAIIGLFEHDTSFARNALTRVNFAREFARRVSAPYLAHVRDCMTVTICTTVERPRHPARQVHGYVTHHVTTDDLRMRTRVA